MSNITFTMIKPEAVAAGNTGAILNKIEGAVFYHNKKVQPQKLK